MAAEGSYGGSDPLIRRLGAVLSALVYVVIAVLLARLWIDPRSWGDPRWVFYVPALLGFEGALLVLTAVVAALLSVVRAAVGRVALAAGLLLLFLGPSVVLLHMHGDEALADYLLVLFVLRFVILVTSTTVGREELLAYSALAAVILGLAILGCVVVTAVIPLPAAGLDPDLMDAIWPHARRAFWETQPQRPLFTAIVYCLGMLWVEWQLIRPQTRGRVETGGAN